MIYIMITGSKVIEIFCIADDFCKEFEAEMTKCTSIHSRCAQTQAKAHDAGC
ncbi:hypothetical protein IX296_000330 [Bacteroides pyogenes]|nr:hypothetical protein [Bacteroides pyogenes]MBR8737022.1 hypothetical protein [Bacteroides pyogenes]MBR8753083.1 hypothetical protein [Bacteroides pyogenes]MBR8794417.1 hypothetical protein [Bacteroides pyogenes]MBR8808072.1 hypothetical protein [Bacteroides pyogenes]